MNNRFAGMVGRVLRQVNELKLNSGLKARQEVDRYALCSMQMSAQICEPFLQNSQLVGLDARKSDAHPHVREDKHHSA